MFNSDHDDDDPFAAFGDDDEEEDEGGQMGSDVRIIAQSLMAQANATKSTTTTIAPTNGRKNNSATSSNNQFTLPDALDHINPLSLPWPDPMYLHSNVILVSSLDRYGGGRGYLATQNIPAGTLVLVEEPLVSWPITNMNIDFDMILFLLQHPAALSIFHALEHFYPTKFEVDELNKGINNPKESADGRSSSSQKNIDAQIKDMINYYKSQMNDDGDGDNESSSQMTQLLHLAKQSNICNSDGKPLIPLDILRLLVALRYNSLETGIYLHVAMLNHADFPDCVKFKTENGRASEVRAIRDISPGESLTISYLPRLLSHATRRAQLWQHHRFDIGGTATTQQVPEMEWIGSKFPPSNIHLSLKEEEDDDDNKDDDTGGVNDSMQRRIEKATAQLSDELRDITNTQKRGSFLLPSDELERVKALELATHELASTAAEKLSNSKHVLLLPCRHLHLRVCDVVLQQLQQQPPSTFRMSSAQRSALLGRLIVTCLHLWQLEEMAYGKDYFALAETLWELAQAVEQVLSQKAHYLTTTLSLSEVADAVSWLSTQHARGVPAALTTVSAWTALEYFARTEHKRIKMLYPQDAEIYIRAAQEPKKPE